MSIRLRLILLVLSVMFPALAAALWVVNSTVAAEREALARNMRDMTQALTAVVDRELGQRDAIAHLLSQSPMLDDWPALPAGNLARFEDQARRAVEGLRGWVALRSTEGELLNTLVPRHGPGAPVLAALRDAPTVLPLARDPASGELSAMVERPVQRAGRTLLNLSVTILPAELQRILDQQSIPAGWVVELLDSNGTLLARAPGGMAQAGRAASPPQRRLLDGPRQAMVDTSMPDAAAALAYVGTPTHGWTCITVVPSSLFAGRLPGAARQVAISSLLLVGLALAVAVWVSRRISRPIDALRSAAADLQCGQPVQRRATGIDECDVVLATLAEASETIQHARGDLEQQVAQAVQRTREAEQRASQSQRVEALGRLTGGVAHDFNNLLGVVSNSAHLIQRTDRAAEHAAPLGAILRAVDLGHRLTQHLLRFAGRQPVRPQVLDLRAYLPTLHELMHTVLGSRVAFSAQAAPDTRGVMADAAELELALINLALNARDAMPQGGAVALRARNAVPAECDGLDAGDYVLISVTDSGTGIDEETAKRVFEPFFTTKGVSKGTGLGLSQVHGFCTQAGGAARLASTPGVGTTVSLLLPAGSAPQATATTVAEPARQGSGLRGRRLLLVEDNAELGAVTAALLQSFGCAVRQVGDADQALRLLDEDRAFDVVLSDVAMSGAMDGLALARELRRRWPQLPVVLVSGFAGPPMDPAEFELLTKPCPPATLVDALQRAIGR